MEGLSRSEIYIETPLVPSKYLSERISRQVFLKLENTQPASSFKLRGISTLCQTKMREGCRKFIGASGGNAGLAVAYSAHELNIPAQLFVPTNTSEGMINKIRSYGATVTICGDDFKLANDEALKAVELDPTAGFIHPFDHPAVWEGNSSLVAEMKKQLKGLKPAAIVLSVGGGGLLIGVLKGLEANGWGDVPIVAVETVGADCFSKSIQAGEIVAIKVTSIAKTLGPRSVAPTLMEMYPKFNIISHLVTDREAVLGCLELANEHGYLVEPACGASVAGVGGNIFKSIRERGLEMGDGPVVVVVCGGADTTPQIFMELLQQFQISL